MTWTAAQSRMLEAMGYEPLRPRGAGFGAAPRAPAATAGAATLAAASTASAAPPRRTAPPLPPTPSSASPASTASAPAAARGAGQAAAFLAALHRAAGGRDVAALVDDLDRLRREPALKRALWPRLRALRRPQ